VSVVPESTVKALNVTARNVPSKALRHSREQMGEGARPKLAPRFLALQLVDDYRLRALGQGLLTHHAELLLHQGQS
jgi:hypothetical protein